MRIAAGVLTHNQFDHGRSELFRKTLASLGDLHTLYVLDNGSTDGTEEWVRRIGGLAIRDPITTCGHGMNILCRILADSDREICVFSNDDIEWKPGWAQVLKRFWEAAPDDIVIASGLLQAEYPWNQPLERVQYGGVPALVRESVPGGAWTFRASAWHLIGPVPEAPGWDDVPTCKRLREKGLKVCSIDLATHLGEEHSTWDNVSERWEKPLDLEKWGPLDPFGSIHV